MPRAFADGSRTPDLAKLFLDLVAVYLHTIVMLSRLGDERMLIPWLMIQLGGDAAVQSGGGGVMEKLMGGGGEFEAILQFISNPYLAKRPLILAYLGRDKVYCKTFRSVALHHAPLHRPDTRVL